MKEVKFRHKFYKLYKDEFTTIRSKKYVKNNRLSIGEIVNIKSPIGNFNVEVTDIKIRKICDIPLDILKEDGDYPNFEIKLHQDFVDLLNTFIPYKSNKLTTEKAIIYFRKIK